MYKISVPIMRPAVAEKCLPELITWLKRCGVERVFLRTCRCLFDEEKYQKDIACIGRLIDVCRQEGFEVGIWIGETMGHGLSFIGKQYAADLAKLTHWTDMYGVPAREQLCPRDPLFMECVTRQVRDMAKLHPSIILLDDDTRLSMFGDDKSAMGCFCDLHVREFCERIGKPMTRDEIRQAVFSGGENEYRNTFLQMKGDDLRNYCKAIRAAIDEVDDTIRGGTATCTTILDNTDGVNAVELAYILAGKNRPILRLAGAASISGRESSRVMLSISQTLNHGHFVRSVTDDIELMAEGDCFPRPRMALPASHLEDLDLIVRADGSFDGMLKYMYDDFTSAHYEPGYFERHIRNSERAKKVEEMFAGKQTTGLHVLCPVDALRKHEFPQGDNFVSSWWSMNNDPDWGQKMALNASIPMAYAFDGQSVTLAFSDAARQLTRAMRQNGVILNREGAEILQKNGVDVGLRGAEPIAMVESERFPEDGEDINLIWGSDPVYRLTLDPKAKVITTILVDGEEIPGVYEYKNANGERFMVFPFDRGENALARNYCRQRQLVASIARLGHPLAASCAGHPDLYMIVKENADEVTIGLLNLSADEMINPTVTLTFDGTVKETLDCRVRQEGRLLHIEGDIISNRIAVITVAKSK